jgi:NADH dehydrogenase
MEPETKSQNASLSKKKIIVVGAGFAGVHLVRNLDKDLFEILLIDKHNYYQFQPLFYQVAASQIEPSSISFPLRKIFQNNKEVQIRMAEVLGVEPVKNRISTSIGSFNYDYLILATGCKPNFFGNPELENHVYTLKSTQDAIKIRNTILQNFEELLSVNEIEKEYLLNIVIVGGGPTGVELAGAFAEIKKNILPKDFPHIDFNNLNIFLLEGSANTLNNMSGKAKKASAAYLNKMNVKVKTNTRVKKYDGKTITLSNGESIKSKYVVWAAGVTGNIIKGIDEKIVINNGRIIVNRFNQTKDHSNIFAVGDIAYMETPKYPKGHPQLANVAINQARNIARNLKAILQNKPLKQYEYTNLGTMATIGKNKAVVDLPFIKFTGHIAWFVWMFLHLMLILSVKNKLIIFINWAWNYFSNDSSLRLILKDDKAAR